MRKETRGGYAALNLFRVELTHKTLLSLVIIDLLKGKRPTIKTKKIFGLGCGICDLEINASLSDNPVIAMCTECGQLYHKECIEAAKKHTPLILCANRNCNGRINSIPLINTIKWVR
jgi:hypothetical protein